MARVGAAEGQPAKGRRNMNYILVGAAAGLITGLLLTPKTGEESRRMVKERFSSVRDRAMRKVSTNGGRPEGESVESIVRADYLH
jgi:gas vesicle protein